MDDRRVVALAGKSPLTREMANHEPPEVEIWGLSDAYRFLNRWDRWFEIHTPDEDGLYRGFTDWLEDRAEQHFAWLWDCGIPVYTNVLDERLPTSVAFPFDAIGSRYRHYWTSTVSYMLSLAAYEGVDEIHLWGIEMAGGTEFAHQRPCTEYWLGVLETQGCRIYIPDCSPILKPMGETYGISTRQPIDTAAILDQICNLDLHTIQQGATPERNGARKALTDLLVRTDSKQRGKIVQPLLTIQTEETDPIKIEAKKQQIRDTVLNNR